MPPVAPVRSSPTFATPPLPVPPAVPAVVHPAVGGRIVTLPSVELTPLSLQTPVAVLKLGGLQIGAPLGRVDGQVVAMQPGGSFSLSKDYAKSAADTYLAARLVDQGVNPYSGLDAALQARCLALLTKQFDDAKNHARLERLNHLPGVATRKLTSASATLLLSLIQASSGDTAKAAIDLFLKMAAEQTGGLKRSMVLNLSASQVVLSPTQSSTFKRLLDELMPAAPPYAEWFSGGKHALKVKQRIHKEFFDEDVAAYEADGFKRSGSEAGKCTLTKTISDGNYQPIDVTIECESVEEFDTDVALLADMNDPSVQLEWYTGHSNLGGNITRAILAAPLVQAGSKLVYLGMCRGKQNLPELRNRFPLAQIATTRLPVSAIGTQAFTSAFFKMVAKRGTYEDLKAMLPGDGDQMLPNDIAQFAFVDLDNDGKMDFAGKPDRLFDISDDVVRPDRAEYTAGPSLALGSLEGARLVGAVGFANTILYYHVEDGDGRSPVSKTVVDHAVADGFFTSDSDEFMRVTTDRVGGETFYRVAVNSRYGDLSADAMGMRMVYELSRYEVSLRTSQPTADDKIRQLLLSYEWTAYMMDSRVKKAALLQKLTALYGWPSEVDYAAVLKKATAGGAYGDSSQVAKVKAALGNIDYSRIR